MYVQGISLKIGGGYHEPNISPTPSELTEYIVYAGSYKTW